MVDVNNKEPFLTSDALLDLNYTMHTEPLGPGGQISLLAFLPSSSLASNIEKLGGSVDEATITS